MNRSKKSPPSIDLDEMREFVKNTQKMLEVQKEQARVRSLELKNKWNRENPEKSRKSIRKHYLTPKGKASSSIAQFRYRSKKKSFRPSKTERLQIGEFYANCPPDMTVDHIIPISRGGLHKLENLQYLTLKENIQKGSKTMDEHLLCQDLKKRDIGNLYRNIGNITSRQMLKLNMKEMRIFLLYLTNKLSEKLTWIT